MSARPLAILAIAAIILSAVVFFGNRRTEQANATDALFAPQLAQQLDAGRSLMEDIASFGVSQIVK